MEHIGVYIHMPFCKRKCYYCDFVSYENKEKLIPKYVEAIKKEIDYNKLSNYIIDTIYMGGGTPSIIDSKYISKILKEIPYNEKTEITIEINPGTVDENKLKSYKEAGINRISIGLQSTDDTILETIGRIHKYSDFIHMYKLARDIGFKNINVDLMLALPGQTLETLNESVDKVIALQPEHISVYSLILEDNTKLKSLVDLGKLTLCSDEYERQMYWSVKKKLEKASYINYEISNFCKPGFYSRHNVDCWEQKQYIGIGAAAHSFKNGLRYSNISSLEEYIENVNSGNIEKNVILEERIEGKAEMDEYMLLGLRKLDGIDIKLFEEKFGVNPISYYNSILEKLKNEDLIVVDNKIKLSKKGLDFANLVWQEFVDVL